MVQKTNIEKQENNKSFGAVIPGISLTETPRKFPWDKPPRLNTPEEALDYVKDMLRDPGVIETVMDLLEIGMTPKFIATSIIKAGWAGNLWNPDVAELIKFPIGALVTIIGMEADIDINMEDEKEDRAPLKRAKFDLKEKNKKEKDTSKEEDVVEEFKGLMSKS